MGTRVVDVGPIAITDAAETFLWKGQYDPCGNLVSTSGPLTNRLRFPGQFADGTGPAGGLYHNGFCTYDPSLGRYLSVDAVTATYPTMHDRLIHWCELRSITRLSEVTRPILERYQRALYLHRKPDGQPLSFASQHERLASRRVRGFFKWLARQGHLLHYPASELDPPKLPARLPKAILTEAEAEQVLTTPDTNDPQGLRDRAILETAYSTGMRRMELAHLKRHDLDQERGTVFVRQGKGKRDRVLPIGELALHWLDRYLVEVRPQFVVEPDEGWLFLTTHGDAFTPQGMTSRVRDWVRASGVRKPGGCHLFRHTMATVMLENGADIRFIQQMLGHANLATTEIYTQVSLRKLQEVHRHTHPTAKLEAEAASASQESNEL